MKNYIGVENEMYAFKGQRQKNSTTNKTEIVYESVNFLHRFNDSFKEKVGSKDRKSRNHYIITDQGINYYVDGTALEMCTSPIVINKGYASRLTDMIMTGRNNIVQSKPWLKFAGYSMHWNVSEDRQIETTDYINGVLLPFYLFAQNPLSGGVRHRSKGRGINSPRHEFMADHLNNEDQIRSLALLLGSYNLARTNKQTPPLRCESCRTLFDEGRDGASEDELV